MSVQPKNTNLNNSKRPKVLSLQGCMASGKTTALKFIESNTDDVIASFEWDDEITNVLNQHNYDKSVLKDYIEVQKIWIDKEIRRYIKATEMKGNCVVFVFGAEEIEFHTLYWPRTIGQAWDVEKYLHKELEELRKCFPDKILFLKASEEKLRSNKLSDSVRQRRYFEYYFNKIMPLKEEWMKGLNNVDYLEVDNLSQEKLGNEVLDWVRRQKEQIHMVESRCGIVCSECTFKEKKGCKGCVNIDDPFWGNCIIKTCCESKSLNNCGECSEIPCDNLKRFSYDEEQGDKGKRIEQCKRWCNR